MFLKDLGEEGLIKELAGKFNVRHPRLIKGIGDDTSVTVQRGGRALLATTDILIEGTHFRSVYTPPYLLGRKSLSISLSDIASMGGEPLFFLVSIALLPDTKKAFVDGLYKGIRGTASEYGVILAGGNTARSKTLMVSTTVFGEAPVKEVVYRSGARPGDIIFITGTVGDSALGLKVLKNHGPGALKGRFKKAALRHLDPAPRMKAGRMLARKRLASAMIDVSDGVALDLKRLSKESGAGALIYLDKLPISKELKRYAALTKDPRWMDLALSGGEDYELLFTAKESDERKVSSLFKKLGVPVTAIGSMVKGAGIKAIGPSGRPIRLKEPGFTHF